MFADNQLVCYQSAIQTVIPEAVLAEALPSSEGTDSPQLVYLDFDGATTSYHNRDLNIDIDNVLVEDSGLDAETISIIVAELNASFGDDIVFTSALPAGGDPYSTIYIGHTNAFDDYGTFLGLAETIDVGNQIHDDNAFVLRDFTASMGLVTSVVAHETEHLLGTLDHGGEDLERYAASQWVTSGQTVNSMTLNSGLMTVFGGGTANYTNVSGGRLVISSGGIANYNKICDAEIDVLSGGVANCTTISGCYMSVASGGFHSGSLQISREASVTIDYGATIDFTVAEQEDKSIALINHLDYIHGADDATYTITVNGQETSGDYMLAWYATSFNKYAPVCIKTITGQVLGNILVGGTLKNGSTTYNLNMPDNALVLTINGGGGSPTPTPPSPDSNDKANNTDDRWTVNSLPELCLAEDWNDWVGYGDTVDYRIMELEYAGELSFSITSTDAAKFTICKKDAVTGKLTLLQATSLTANKAKTQHTAITKEMLLDAGDYYVSVECTNKATNADGDYTVSLATGVFFPLGDNSDDVWTMQNLPEFSVECSDWVGYGDSVDYRVLNLDMAARIVFDVTATDAAKFTIWKEDTKTNKLKSLQATAAKANKVKTEFAVTTKDLLLDKGTYYLSVEATNAKKGGSADYTVSYNERTVFFDQGDNTDDVWTMRELPSFDGEWEDWTGYGDAVDYRVLNLDVASRVSFDVNATDATKFTVWSVDAKSGKLKSLQATATKANKAKTEYTVTTKDLLLEAGTYYLSVENTNAKKGGSADYSAAFGERTVFFDQGDNSDDTWNGEGVSEFFGAWEDWAGYGDAADFRVLELDTAACLNFDVVANDAAKFTVWQMNEKTGKLKSLQATALKGNKAKTEFTASTKNLMVVAGTYYLSVEATNAKKGGSADYVVSEGTAFERFPEGDNTNDTWKSAASQDAFWIGENLFGWVGFGDAADYFKLEVEDAGKLCLTFDEETEAALKGKQIKFTCLDAKGKSVSLAAFSGESINSSKELAEGVYYIGVSCANVQKYNTSYNLNVGMLA